MTANAISGSTRRRAFYAALAFFVISMIFMGGRFYSGDAEAYFTVGFQLTLGRLPAISERLVGYGVRGTAGLLYAKFGLGFSLVLMPLIGTTLFVASLSGAKLAGPVLYLSAHLIGPMVGGAGVYLFHTLQTRLGIVRRGRLAGTVFFAFGGLWLVYSRFLFSELLAGVLLLILVHGMLGSGIRGDWIVALTGAFLVLVRSEMVLIAGPLILLRIYDERRLLPHLSAFVLGGAIFGWYNWLRFGNPIYTGMGHSAVETFSTPIPLGLYGQFFAPGNGLFLYAPYLIPPLVVAGVMLGRTGLYRDRFMLTLAVGVVAYLLVHSAWHSWMGGWSWGPRRVIPLLGLLHLSVGFTWSSLSTSLRGLIWGLLPVSLLLNTAGLIGNFNDYYRGLFYSRDVLFRFQYAQVIAHNQGIFNGTYPIDNLWLNLFGVNDGFVIVGGLLVVGGLLTREFFAPSRL